MRKAHCATPPLEPSSLQQQSKMARNRRCKPVSVTYRTGLEFAETAIGKWQAETGAAKPPVQRRNSRICRPETRARQPNPRECRRFSHTRKSHSGDHTGWLGWEDSNSQMSLQKLTFEVWPEFTFVSERLAIRDFSQLCQSDGGKIWRREAAGSANRRNRSAGGEDRNRRAAAMVAPAAGRAAATSP